MKVASPIPTGSKYWNLTVLGREPIFRDGSKHYYYKCACKCGKIVHCSRTDLENWDVKSCGCQIELYKDNNDPLIGKAYGSLTIIGNTYPIGNDRACPCKCKCSKILWVKLSELRSGKVTYCSKRRHKVFDTIEDGVTKFHALTVISHYYKNDQLYCKVKCDCGNTAEYLYTALKNGVVRTCGCRILYKRKNYASLPEWLSEVPVIDEEKQGIINHTLKVTDYIHIKCPTCGIIYEKTIQSYLRYWRTYGVVKPQVLCKSCRKKHGISYIGGHKRVIQHFDGYWVFKTINPDSDK